LCHEFDYIRKTLSQFGDKINRDEGFTRKVKGQLSALIERGIQGRRKFEMSELIIFTRN